MSKFAFSLLFPLINKKNRYYYQFQNERLPACNSTPHGLLHVADDALNLGPVWVFWCFLMERFCGSLVAEARSRSNPYPAISTLTLQRSQLQHIFWKYPGIGKKIQWPPSVSVMDNNADRSGMVGDEFMTSKEVVYPNCKLSTTILR